jgi:hypothetical protein
MTLNGCVSALVLLCVVSNTPGGVTSFWDEGRSPSPQGLPPHASSVTSFGTRYYGNTSHALVRFYTPGGVTSFGTSRTHWCATCFPFLYAWRRDFVWDPTPLGGAVTSEDDVRLHGPPRAWLSACGTMGAKWVFVLVVGLRR